MNPNRQWKINLSTMTAGLHLEDNSAREMFHHQITFGILWRLILKIFQTFSAREMFRHQITFGILWRLILKIFQTFSAREMFRHQITFGILWRLILKIFQTQNIARNHQSLYLSPIPKSIFQAYQARII
jgi:hypothetical protein